MDKSNCKKESHCQDNGMYCIDTYRILDSGKSKDCIENTRVYFTESEQEVLNKSISVRTKSSKILWTQIETNPTPFSNGYYNIAVRFYFLVNIDCCLGGGITQEIHGLAIYDKTALLYGGEVNVASFSSDISLSFCGDCQSEITMPSNLPRVVIEVAEPVILKVEVTQDHCHCNCRSPLCEQIPPSVNRLFNGNFVTRDDQSNKNLFISLGLFSLIRLERPTQIVVPACDVCVPPSCPKPSDSPADPCALFREMDFPIEDFFPDPTPSVKEECSCNERVFDPKDYA